MLFGSGKGFHDIDPSPDMIPIDWLSDGTTNFAIRCFGHFLQADDLDISELKRLRILVKKGVKDFLEPVVKKGHYENISSFTLLEIESLSDLSDKKYNRVTNFFKTNKVNNVQLNGKNISLFTLKEFTPITQVDSIPFITTADIPDKESKEFVCKHCNGSGVVKNFSYDRQSDNRSQRKEWVTCGNCHGTGHRGFYFQKFKKFVEKYNKKIEKANNEILDLNNKSVKLVDEYNNTIEKLNEKIRIWNSKCPENAVDRNHEGKDDYIKYWHDDAL